ncbi:unnamed protein product [Euphydryas editha]|nr:unnamed protein product [Euphydryas editha]
MTKDHDRFYVVKIFDNEYPSLFDIYKYSIMICELLQAFDYNNSIINVLDARDCNIVALAKAINFVHFRQCMSITMEGYKMRIKEFHFITPSKAIDTLVTMFKQVLSPKLSQRIHVHKNLDTLYEYVPKEICPKDFGGNEKSIKEPNDNLMDVLTSKEFTKYFNESISKKTNEEYRSVYEFNEQCMDMPGSFRRLTLD